MIHLLNMKADTMIPEQVERERWGDGGGFTGKGGLFRLNSISMKIMVQLQPEHFSDVV